MTENSFSLNQYSKFLKMITCRYDVVGPEIFSEIENISNQLCLIRHDIDRSPKQAEKIAFLEAEHEVKSTYFVLINGDQYSPFEKIQREALKNILGYGHSVGLHFDASWNEIDDSESLEENLAWEKNILQNLLETEITSFSFHNPSESTDKFRALKYSELWNYYSDQIRANFAYISDSNGFWRAQSLENFLNEGHQRIHILTHPEWWGYEDFSPGEIVARQISERAASSWKNYSESLLKSGRENITEIGSAVSNLPKVYGDGGYKLVHEWLVGNWKTSYLELCAVVEKDFIALLSFLCAPLNDKSSDSKTKINLGSKGNLWIDKGSEEFKIIGSSIRSYVSILKQKRLILDNYSTIERDDFVKSFVEMSDMSYELEQLFAKSGLPDVKLSKYEQDNNSVDLKKVKKFLLKNRKGFGISAGDAYSFFGGEKFK